MPVITTRSTDPGASPMTGQVGSILPVFDELLLAAGWSTAFTGTNIKVWRNAVGDGRLGMYLRVVDNGSGSGGAREFSIQCFASMSDVDTGSHGTGAVWFRKSSLLDATARPYVGVADERTLRGFYAHAIGDNVTNSNIAASSFVHAGEMDCIVNPNNPFRYTVIGRSSQNTASPGASDYTYGRVASNQPYTAGNAIRVLDPATGAPVTPFVWGNTPIDSLPGGNAGSLAATYTWTNKRPFGALYLLRPTHPFDVMYRVRGAVLPWFAMYDMFAQGGLIEDKFIAAMVRNDSDGDTHIGALCPVVV